MKNFFRDRVNGKDGGNGIVKTSNEGSNEFVNLGATVEEEVKEETEDDIKVMAGQNLVDMDLALSAWQRYLKQLKKGGYFYSSGFATHDLYHGGIIRTALVTVAAATGEGKSSYAIAMAYQMCLKGYYVIFVSLEEEITDCINRLACTMSEHVTLSHLNASGGPPKEILESLLSCGPRLRKLPMKWGGMGQYEDFSRSVKEEVRAIREEDPQAQIVVFLDYIGRLRYRGLSAGQADKYMSVSTIARNIKDLAKKLRVPHVVLAQLNREQGRTKDKTPKLDHLADSSELGKESNLVIMLRRPGYNPEDEESDVPDNRMTVRVVKNRNGPVGKYELEWLGPRATVKELESQILIAKNKERYREAAVFQQEPNEKM